VPLAPDDNSAAPGISTTNGKAIVTTKPGDVLVVHGKREKVARVEVYRERLDVVPEDDPNSPRWAEATPSRRILRLVLTAGGQRRCSFRSSLSASSTLICGICLRSVLVVG
jgi:hypothetical protein